MLNVNTKTMKQYPGYTSRKTPEGKPYWVDEKGFIFFKEDMDSKVWIINDYKHADINS